MDSGVKLAPTFYLVTCTVDLSAHVKLDSSTPLSLPNCSTPSPYLPSSLCPSPSLVFTSLPPPSPLLFPSPSHPPPPSFPPSLLLPSLSHQLTLWFLKEPVKQVHHVLTKIARLPHVLLMQLCLVYEEVDSTLGRLEGCELHAHLLHKDALNTRHEPTRFLNEFLHCTVLAWSRIYDWFFIVM